VTAYGEISAIEQAAWAGGVLEAKGYYNHKRGNRHMLRLTDDRACLLERFAEIVGAGRVFPERKDHGGTRYRWELYARDDIERVLENLDPYLSEEGRERLSFRFERALA
jgi:hypothetical protein